MVNTVHKFGGSSLSTSERYQHVAKIIIANSQAGDCVVVSAAGKTTDTLVKLWQSYLQKDSQALNDILLLLHNQQKGLIDPLLHGDIKHETLQQLDNELLIINQHISQKKLSEAALLAHGELWSARLLAAYLQTLAIPAHALDARTLFTLSDGQLLTQKNIQQTGQYILAEKINVVTGFIAANVQGETVTFGRNGSDYSASLLAYYCHANSVSIWTDTQGVFSTDPRKVKQAIKYSKVCRGQAHLLALLGNPVLHAKTLSPLKNTDIKLAVRSSFDIEATPTEVVKEGYTKQKRFITTLTNVDLLRVEGLHSKEVAHVSQLIQQSLHHFNQHGETYIIVPAHYTHQVVSYFAGRANISESNLNGCALVASESEALQLCTQAQELLNQQRIEPRFIHQGGSYAIILTEQVIDSDVLSELHERLINKGQELAIIIAGLGNVGEVFINQLSNQINRLAQHFDVKLVGLLRSKTMLFNASGVCLDTWQKQYKSEAAPYKTADLLEQIKALDYDHKVVIDITASHSFSQLYLQFSQLNCHLISANKYAGTAATPWYNTLRNHLAERNLHWRYNASVGAGLPINFALADLQNSGDEVIKIEGVFSGTLSWLCSRYDGSVAFSELLFNAQKMGITEPDPREDLSGRDMQRKLLILARELGIELDLADISLSPLMPQALTSGSWDDFIDNKQLLDSFISEQADLAEQNNAVLRYTGVLEVIEGKVVAQVGINFVAKGHALANLTPGDNIFVINSQFYKDNALVIQGPGAGTQVTAAGIHSDLFWLVQALK
ncbi:bifunctional aspartate kinase/homoserine dehydrogenase II [Pseudoalteromonas sp. MMG010]|uniref:bifunctional aspartate kinase/homoserine dehydrogenase II n=1 Tax=Pseudoalteromonas sp. MMG010 TaxID=2822685 RepID=UPI001B3A5E6D|nr:bifunctional aspartate kinase/homoserine dehydrogenase II [Pseudoalteromonas sp. MMG010]MBQ4832623.1 bifunctional aspartate kinase/homoserine dehydrogenase II [Pseudoalteromonas sp. MMG010]